LILFMLNPVYLYWSLRLMADSFFGLLALISVYLYYSKIKPTLGLRTLNKITIVYTSLLGFLSALAILTRFEGYILFFSLGCAMYWGLLPLNINSFKFSVLINQLQHSLLRLVGYVLSSLVVLIPYLHKNNPFSSSYLSEPNSRVYDINTLAIFILSLLFVFGFYFGFYFLYKNKNEVLKFYKENPLILIFTLLEVLLVLAWPAAVPRLFTPVIPFLIIPLAYSINTFFESGFLILYKIPIFNKKLKVFDISFMLSLMLIYVLGQYIYKLQFLIVLRFVFVALVLLHIVMLYTIYKKLSNVFYLLLVSILLLWSIATIWIHKDIHSVIKDASLYLVKQNAVVLHNDISSVTPWYLENRAIYSHTLRRLDVDQTELKLNNITHVLVTNEHNVNLGLKLDTFDFLTKEAEFSREVNGAVFKTVVYKVEQERL
ncbi:hypothetical protein KC980_01200, partial [candidate division WWE3 bacterium]|nr:hypothetical protein [candidate division WWE3 bacterium]